MPNQRTAYWSKKRSVSFSFRWVLLLLVIPYALFFTDLSGWIRIGFQQKDLASLWTTYRLNILLTAVVVCGVVLLATARPDRRTSLALGLLFVCMPLWMPFSYQGNAIHGIANGQILRMLVAAPACLWGMLPLRGRPFDTLPQAVVALVLMVRALFVAYFQPTLIHWPSEILLVCVAVAWGSLTDCAINGLSPRALITLVTLPLWFGLRLLSGLVPSLTDALILQIVIFVAMLESVAFGVHPYDRTWGPCLAPLSMASCAVGFLITGTPLF